MEWIHFPLLDKFLATNIGKISIAILILILTYFINNLKNKIIIASIKKKGKTHGRHFTASPFFRHILSSFVWMIGFTFAIFQIPALRELSISIFASASVLAVVVGFSAQQALSNIISGAFISVFNPFSVGDRIRILDTEGIVTDINLRHTTIRTLENKRVIIPNQLMGKESIENFHIEDEKICVLVIVHLSYKNDIDLAMSLIKEEAESHPDCLDIRRDKDKNAGVPKVGVNIVELGELSIKVRATTWALNPDIAYKMHWELHKSIKRKLDENKILFAHDIFAAAGFAN